MRPLNDIYLTHTIADVSTASSVRLYVPDNGAVIQVKTVLANAITVADSIITCTANTGTTARTLGTITVAFTGSAEGDIDTLELAQNSTAAQVKEGDWLEIATDGGSTTAAVLDILVIIRR